MRRSNSERNGLVAGALVVALAFGCKNERLGAGEVFPAPSNSSDGGPKASEAERLLAERIPAEKVQAIVNPSKLEPYRGKTGVVRGTILVSGDEAPSAASELREVTADCPNVEATYGKAFREGPGRVLADALVAVTGYEGYVPASDEPVRIEGSGCAWDRRTIAMTYGQTLEVRAADRKPYVPDIHGMRFPAQLFAFPGQKPLALVPREPGRFTFYDAMRLYARAELFVLPYPTAAVSDGSGRFEIRGVPVGKAKLTALLPASGGTVGEDIEVTAEKPVEVTLTIPFVAKDYKSNFVLSPSKRVITK